jgi:hypothetical protein
MKHNIKHICFLCLLALFLASCSDSPTESERQLDAAFQRWQVYQFKSYVIDQIVGCFCPDAGRWHRLYVVDNKIVKMIDLETGSEIPNQWGLFKTVDELFDLLYSVDPEEVAQFQAEYHPTFGYPTNLYIDYHARMADEEIGYTCENLDEYSHSNNAAGRNSFFLAHLLILDNLQ